MAHVEHKVTFFFGNDLQFRVSIENSVVFNTVLIKLEWREGKTGKTATQLLDRRACNVLIALLTQDEK